MLTCFNIRDGKAFAAKQKLRELKKRIFRFKALEKRLLQNPKPYEMMEKPVDNMNNLPFAKYKQTPNEIEKDSLNSEASKEIFIFLRLKKIIEENVKQEKFNKKNQERKKVKLRSPLEVEEEVLVLAS